MPFLWGNFLMSYRSHSNAISIKVIPTLWAKRGSFSFCLPSKHRLIKTVNSNKGFNSAAVVLSLCHQHDCVYRPHTREDHLNSNVSYRIRKVCRAACTGFPHTAVNRALRTSETQTKKWITLKMISSERDGFVHETEGFLTRRSVRVLLLYNTRNMAPGQNRLVTSTVTHLNQVQNLNINFPNSFYSLLSYPSFFIYCFISFFYHLSYCLPGFTLFYSLFLGAFAKLRKASTRFVICLFVRPRGTTRLPLDGLSWTFPKIWKQ
jgi:hypothetical protein